jgi:hypothetical protein
VLERACLEVGKVGKVCYYSLTLIDCFWIGGYCSNRGKFIRVAGSSIWSVNLYK